MHQVTKSNKEEKYKTEASMAKIRTRKQQAGSSPRTWRKLTLAGMVIAPLNTWMSMSNDVSSASSLKCFPGYSPDPSADEESWLTGQG